MSTLFFAGLHQTMQHLMHRIASLLPHAAITRCGCTDHRAMPAMPMPTVSRQIQTHLQQSQPQDTEQGIMLVMVLVIMLIGGNQHRRSGV